MIHLLYLKYKTPNLPQNIQIHPWSSAKVLLIYISQLAQCCFLHFFFFLKKINKNSSLHTIWQIDPYCCWSLTNIVHNPEKKVISSAFDETSAQRCSQRPQMQLSSWPPDLKQYTAERDWHLAGSVYSMRLLCRIQTSKWRVGLSYCCKSLKSLFLDWINGLCVRILCVFTKPCFSYRPEQTSFASYAVNASVYLTGSKMI